MKNRLTFILVMLMSITNALAQTKIDILTGEIVDKTTPAVPQQTVETFDDGVRVTYTFDYVRLDSIFVDNSDRFIFSFDGFGLCDIPGYPCLPSRINTLEVPDINNASIHIEEFEYSEYHMEIAPAREADVESAEVLTPSALQSISVGSGFYPLQPASICHTENYRGKDLCFIKVSPVLYDHDSHTVRIANKIVYRLSFGDVASSARLSKMSASEDSDLPIIDDHVYSNIVLNATTSESEDCEIKNGLLIVTTTDFEESVRKFAKWKNALGIKSYILMKDKWSGHQEVKDSINAYYRRQPDIQYLLLVGDAQSVPSEIRTAGVDNHKYCTDSQYVTGNSYFVIIPLFHKGRIPACNNEEAAIAFNKIINYERCEVYCSNFFEQGLHCASFDTTYSIDLKHEARRFVRTSEEILESVREFGIFPTRAYYATTYHLERPLYYSANPKYGQGEPLPSEFMDFSTYWINESTRGKGAEQIKQALQDGGCYVLYRGHGTKNGWKEPEYTVDNIDQEYLPSYGLFPVVFSLCCQTGDFYGPDKCFAAKSLLSKNGGGSCVFAATEDLYSGHNDVVSLAIFDAFLPNAVKTSYMSPRNESQAYKPVYRMGQILDQALYRMTEKDYLSLGFEYDYTVEQYHRLHCFGDPTMWIRFQEPTPFENADIDIDYETKRCRVSTGEGPAYISFYDSNTNTVKCVYGESAEFTFSNLHSAGSLESPYYTETITISAPNRIPYIHDKWHYDSDQVSAKILTYRFTDVLEVTYRCNETSFAIITLTNAMTGSQYVSKPVIGGYIEIDASSITPGTPCILTLTVNGVNVDSKKIRRMW